MGGDGSLVQWPETFNYNQLRKRTSRVPVEQVICHICHVKEGLNTLVLKPDDSVT